MEILFIIVIVILFFLLKFNASKIKGAIGESRVAGRLKKLQSEEFVVFNDVLIRTSNGTSQIDHIVISIYGIFVIETKNYSGWIHGNENSEYWTQTIYKTKNKFRNPIKQNWSHVYALKEVLSDFQQVDYYPLVVFTSRAELKNVYAKMPVIYDYQIVHTIKDRRIPNLSIEQVANIADKLDEVIIQDRKGKKDHVSQILNHAYERKQKENSLVCPRCGGNLVERNGKYGKFFGCSNYPKCRYTLNSRG